LFPVAALHPSDSSGKTLQSKYKKMPYENLSFKIVWNESVGGLICGRVSMIYLMPVFRGCRISGEDSRAEKLFSGESCENPPGKLA